MGGRSARPPEARPLSLVFFLLHPGYIRYFTATFQLLTERGHTIHLAFALPEKDPGDAALLEALLRDEPRITAGPAPARAPGDGWRAVALLVRGLTDLARFAHPRYAGAPMLRERIRNRFRTIVADAPRLNGPARRVCRVLIDVASAPASARRADAQRRLLAAAERAIPTAPPVDAFLRGLRPNAVLASPVVEFGSTQVEPLKSARRLGIPSAVAVASWDNLTGKGLLRVVPDRVFVWNETQRGEAAEMHGIPAERVVVTGAPKFDEWFERRPSRAPEEFAARVGLPGPDYVLYVCSSPFIAPDEVSFVREWLSELRRQSDIGVVVRPHPQNAAQWRDVSLDDPSAVVWPPDGAQPDAGEARADFFDSLAHASAVVGVNTSALIEAAIVGKPVLTVLTDRFRGTQEGTLHFHYLLHENGGFLHVARRLDEHVEQLREALESGSERADRFVDAFVRPLGRDVYAALVLADEIEKLGRSRPLGAPRPSSLLRLALTPLAVAAGAMARRSETRSAQATLAD